MIRPRSTIRLRQSEGALVPHFSRQLPVLQESQHGFHSRSTEYDQGGDMPELEEFLAKRDYAGAITLLRFEKSLKIPRDKQELWLAYCYFHAGLFYKALRIIDRLLVLYTTEGQSSQLCTGASEYAEAGEQRTGRKLHSQSSAGRKDDGMCTREYFTYSDIADSQTECDRNRKNFSFRRSIHVPKELQDSDLDSSDDEEATANAVETAPIPRSSATDEVPRRGADPEHEDGAYQSKLHLYRAVCLYAMSAFQEAQQAAFKAPPSRLRRHLLLHIAFQLKEEDVMQQLLGELDRNDVADQMCLASIEFLRHRTDVAWEIYRTLQAKNPTYQALKVSAALCALKCGQYKTAKSLLKEYQGTSLAASNLLACCIYEEGGGPSACLKVYHQMARQAGCDEASFIQKHDLLRHNACVFQKGDNLLEVFGPLARILPEARLNLVTVFLKHQNYSAAFNLMQDFTPSTIPELMCKANVFLLFGQRRHSLPHLKDAAKMFFAVASTSGSNKIGLQSMFNYCFLKKDYRGALDCAERLESFSNDSTFYWNKCLALAFEGEYEEAKEALVNVEDAQCEEEFLCLRWLCRLHILTGDSSAAINLCIQQIKNPPPIRATSMACSWDGCALLKETADDCYAVGDFYAALKAFSLLDKEKCDPLLWPALRGAAAGFLHKLLTQREEVSRIPEVVQLLRHCSATKVTRIVSCLKKVAKYHNVSLK